MAERLTVTKELVTSFRKEQSHWQLVIQGLRLAAIGVGLSALGVVLTFLGPTLGTYLPDRLIAAVMAIGVFCNSSGLIAMLIGFAQCLVVPRVNCQILLLAALLLAMYAASGPLSSLVILSNPQMRGSERLTSEVTRQVAERAKERTLANIPYSAGASILLGVFMLSLAAYIGSEDLMKRIHLWWLVQYGGSLAMLVVVAGVAWLFSILDMPFIGAMITIVVLVVFGGFLISLIYRVLRQTADELDKVSKFAAKQGATPAKKKPPTRSTP